MNLRSLTLTSLGLTLVACPSPSPSPTKAQSEATTGTTPSADEPIEPASPPEPAPKPEPEPEPPAEPFAGPLDPDDWRQLLARDPYAKGVELRALSNEDRQPMRLGPYVCMGRNHPRERDMLPPGESPPPKPKRVSYAKAALLARAQLEPSIGTFAIDVEISQLVGDASDLDLIERFGWGRAKGYACTCPLITWTPNMITEEVIIEWRDYWIRLKVTGSLSNLGFESHAIQLLGALADIDREALRPELLYAKDCVFHALDIEPMLAFYADHDVGDGEPGDRPPKVREASRLFPVAERPD